MVVTRTGAGDPLDLNQSQGQPQAPSVPITINPLFNPSTSQLTSLSQNPPTYTGANQASGSSLTQGIHTTHALPNNGQDHNCSFHSSASNTDPPPVTEVRSTPELDTLVSSIVSRVLEQQGKQLLENIINPTAPRFSAVDQIILPQYQNDTHDLEKIPDIVRCLRNFSGETCEFSSWKKSVERVLKLYENIKGTTKYYGILNVIRNKITGQADAALEINNTPLDWKSIVNCLSMSYADKRDISTLEYQMSGLVQGNSSIQQFYQSVTSHLTLIINNISCMDMCSESMKLLTKTYRDKALDTFIRGLKGNLSDLLAMKEPADLPTALYLCQKYENQHFRSQYVHNNHGAIKKNFAPQAAHTRPQNSSPLKDYSRYLPKQVHRTYYTPPVQQVQQPYHSFQPYREFQSNRPLSKYPQSQSKPSNSSPPIKKEPLTQKTGAYARDVHNQNRQRFNDNSWRANAPIPQNVQTTRYQPNYHIDPSEDELNQYYQNLRLSDEQDDQTFEDYVENTTEKSGNPEELEHVDINFLG